jgi:hypothetical protein
MRSGDCSLKDFISAVVAIPLIVLSLCHVCSVTSLSLIVTACTSPSSGKNDSVAKLSNLPFTGNGSVEMSGFLGISDAERDLSAPRGESDVDVVFEGLGSGEGSILTSGALGVGRSKYGLPNGNLVANDSQSGFTHSERGTNVDINTVPSGGDVPVSRGRSDRIRFLAGSGASVSGFGSSTGIGGGLGAFSFEMEARVGFLAAIVASEFIGVSAEAGGIGSTIVGGTVGVRESKVSSFSPTLEIQDRDPKGN